MNITDKTAIVTGASSGLGKAISKALIQKGAFVYGLARSADKLDNLHEELGNPFRPVMLDVSDHKAIEQWIHQTFSEEDTPELLINNAGVALFNNVDELSLEEWHTMIHTNLNGVFYMTQKIVPYMKKNNNSCHIINIASIAGKIGTPKMSGYNASKYGVRGFSEALFKELRYDGIKVTCFCPGSIETPFFEKAEEVTTHANMMQPPAVAKTLMDIIETPDNFLINEITMRPLNPKPPE
jgi:NADP-dependent 3-hydroxy acid dehydrogenase YdfG